MNYLTLASEVVESTNFFGNKIKENRWYFTILSQDERSKIHYLQRLHLNGREDYRIVKLNSVSPNGLHFYEESYTYPGLNFRFSRVIFTTSEYKNLSAKLGHNGKDTCYYFETGSFLPFSGFDPITGKYFKDCNTSNYKFSLDESEYYSHYLKDYLALTACACKSALFTCKCPNLNSMLGAINNAELFDYMQYRASVFIPEIVIMCPVIYFYLPFQPVNDGSNSKTNPHPTIDQAAAEESIENKKSNANITWVQVVQAMIAKEAQFTNQKTSQVKTKKASASVPTPSHADEEHVERQTSSNSLSPKKKRNNRAKEVLQDSPEYATFDELPHISSIAAEHATNATEMVLWQKPTNSPRKASKNTNKKSRSRAQTDAYNEDSFLDEQCLLIEMDELRILLNQQLQKLLEQIQALQIEKRAIHEEDVAQQVNFNQKVEDTVDVWCKDNIHLIYRLRLDRNLFSLFIDKFNEVREQIVTLKFDVATPAEIILSPLAYYVVLNAVVFLVWQKYQEQNIKEDNKKYPEYMFYLDLLHSYGKASLGVITFAFMTLQAFFLVRQLVIPKKRGNLFFSNEAQNLLKNEPHSSDIQENMPLVVVEHHKRKETNKPG